MNPNRVGRYTACVCRACEGSGLERRVNPKWLRNTRLDARVSLREMARRLGFSAAYISDIELGRRSCGPLIDSEYAKLSTTRKESTR